MRVLRVTNSPQEEHSLETSTAQQDLVQQQHTNVAAVPATHRLQPTKHNTQATGMRVVAGGQALQGRLTIPAAAEVTPL